MLNKPATKVNFSHLEEAQAWFQNQSREVCIVLAMRSALRLLPLRIMFIDDLAPALELLPVFRLNFVTWAIGKYPSQHERLQTCLSEAFNDGDLRFFHPPQTYSITLAARAAAAVVVNQDISYIASRDWNKNQTYARVVFENIYASAAYAVTVGNIAFDNSAFVQADAVAVEQGRAIPEIVGAPLWPGEIPERIVIDWKRLRAWMLKNPTDCWEPWVEWYERVRDGSPSFGKAFDLAVASLTNQQCWASSYKVNHHIAALLAEHTKPDPIEGLPNASKQAPQTIVRVDTPETKKRPDYLVLEERELSERPPTRLGRHIVLFLDGTGNTPEELVHAWPSSSRKNSLTIDQISPPPITNVIRLMRGVVTDDSVTLIPQVINYFQGVGTEGSNITKKLESVTGSGLSRIILEAYRFISHNLEWKGDYPYLGRDKIFVFGFSRGAYEARALCGFLHRVGLLKKKNLWMLPFLFERYQQLLYFGEDFDANTKRTLHQAVHDDYRSIPVHFLGVWDTVGTLGFQGVSRMTANYEPFFDTSLTPNITYAYHALAIHELREPFKPVFWSKLGKSGQTLEQVWFAGAHSNIGGGYKQTGLSNFSLDWMAYKAHKAGLILDTDYFQDELQRLKCPESYAEKVALSRRADHGEGSGLRSRIKYPSFTRPISLEDINKYLRQRDRSEQMAPEVFETMKIHWSVKDRLATPIQYTAERSHFEFLDKAVQELDVKKHIVDGSETLFSHSSGFQSHHSGRPG